MAAHVAVTSPLRDSIYADHRAGQCPSSRYIVHGMGRINVIMDIKLRLVKNQTAIVFIVVQSDIPH
jgi:hypothetical protein